LQCSALLHLLLTQARCPCLCLLLPLLLLLIYWWLLCLLSRLLLSCAGRGLGLKAAVK
jgi:hypothetical protein